MKIIKNTITLFCMAVVIMTAAAVVIRPVTAGFRTFNREEPPESQTDSLRKDTTEGLLITPLQSAPPVMYRPITPSEMEGRNLRQIVSEDFSKMTEGSEEEPGELFPTINVPDEMTQTPGWTCGGGAPAGGMFCLPGPARGALNTPYFDFSGKIIVKFRVKAIADGETAQKPWVFTTLCVNGVLYPDIAEGCDSEQFQPNSENGWTELAYEITTSVYNSESFVQWKLFSTQGSGILLDDIEIYRDMDYVYAPSALAATDFTRDGFTATWASVATADSYLLTLLEEDQPGTEDAYGLVDFNDIDLSTGKLQEKDIPEGWDIHLTCDEQVTDKGVGNTPGVMLHSNSDEYIDLPQTGGLYKNVRFDFRKLEADSEPGYFTVYGLNPSTNKWDRYAIFQPSVNITSVDFSEIEETYGSTYAFTGKYLGVRLVVESGDMSGVVIDNIEYVTEPPRPRATLFADRPVDSTSFTLEGLDPYKEHYFSVKSVKGDEVTESSPLTHALGISPTIVLPVTNVDSRGGFTANWEETPRADRYEVRAYRVETMSQDEQAHEILSESFDKIDIGNKYPQSAVSVGNTNDMIDLDEYTDLPGWHGRGNLVCDGMLGCESDENSMFELYTPTITTSNNGGSYQVYVRAWAEAGTIIIIQNSTMYEALGWSATGIYEATVTLTGGQDDDQVMFYSYTGTRFLLDTVTITQDVRQGDRFYKLRESVETTDTQYDFIIEPEEGYTYGYRVKSYQTIFGNTVDSGDSDMAVFDFNESSVDKILDDSTTGNIRGGSRCIRVSLPSDAEITVYDLSGRKVMTARGVCGENTLRIAPGIYVVTADGITCKVGVRM